jgi:hypothetical protein
MSIVINEVRGSVTGGPDEGEERGTADAPGTGTTMPAAVRVDEIERDLRIRVERRARLLAD